MKLKNFEQENWGFQYDYDAFTVSAHEMYRRLMVQFLLSWPCNVDCRDIEFSFKYM